MKRVWLGILAVACWAGCSHTRAVPPDVLASLEKTPGGVLTGEVQQVKELAVLNNQDFVWTLAFSPDAKRVAFTQLGVRSYLLGLWSLGPPPAKLAEPVVNPLEWDVEAVAFAPDGKSVAVGSRDASVRIFDAATGADWARITLDEPIVSVAYHPTRPWLVAGSSKGLLVVLSLPELKPVFELRAHSEEVRALAFDAAGTLFSGGWDKQILRWKSEEQQAVESSVRLRFEKQGGALTSRVGVNERGPFRFAFDDRLPMVVLGTEAALVAGIDVATLQETQSVPTASGTTLARVARAQRLSFKWLTLSGVDVAICDACLPTGVQGVVGKSLQDRFDRVLDEASQELVLTPKEAPATSGAQRALLALKVDARFAFPFFVNDFSLDARGKTLGVAFSETKAERNRQVYEREKKGIQEPKAEGNAGAMVDAVTGKVLHRWPVHAGVVSTVGISPDGKTLVTGGWDKQIYVVDTRGREPRAEVTLGWSLRRLRFSPDGRYIGAAAWTPQNPSGDHSSDPAAVIYEVAYEPTSARLMTSP